MFTLQNYLQKLPDVLPWISAIMRRFWRLFGMLLRGKSTCMQTRGFLQEKTWKNLTKKRNRLKLANLDHRDSIEDYHITIMKPEDDSEAGAVKSCETPGCDKEAKLQCPTCIKLQIKVSIRSTSDLGGKQLGL